MTIQKIDLFSTDVPADDALSEFAVFDFETTGVEINGKDEPTELAIIKVQNGQIVDELHSLIQTDVIINRKVGEMTSINNAQLRDAKDRTVLFNEVYRRYADLIFVGHSCHGFDAKIFMRYSPELFRQFKFLDTRTMARDLLPGLKRIGYTQTDLCNLFGIVNEGTHTAIGDTQSLMKVFLKLKSLLDDPSQLDNYIKKGNAITKRKKE
jgi:DNA polymerase-3 subunit epsilon